MCTLAILYRPSASWPVILGANRDEMIDRRWQPPARHWPEWPGIVAGLDEQAGGSWLGMNDDGVVAAILNRQGSLGPADGKRSRGDLVLAALDNPSAAAAADAIQGLDAREYRPFNLVVADRDTVIWLRNEAGRGTGGVERAVVPEGVSLLTERELDDRESPRIARYLDRFRAAAAPDPETGDWAAWQALLANREPSPDQNPTATMSITTDFGFGTTSSSLIALPRGSDGTRKPVWLFASGRPDLTDYAPVEALARAAA
ncbi:MAG: NRDE family protein [Bauldia litoralis]